MGKQQAAAVPSEKGYGAAASAAMPVLSGRTGGAREEMLALFWETEIQWGFYLGKSYFTITPKKVT